MTVLIEADAPATWQELESRVARILSECGYDIEVQKSIELARGDVRVDVWADDHSVPPNVIVVECKHWATAATKNTVHGFRTVVGDSGANTGLLVSTAGFQDGAVEAAAYSNVRLLSWEELQTLFADRWYRSHMARRLREEAEPLIEYAEPINARIARKEKALGDERLEQIRLLRERHFGLAMGLMPMYLEVPGGPEALALPGLPLREGLIAEHAKGIPAAVLDAAALRPFLEALTEAFRAAVAEFDQVFGERA